MFEQTKRDTVIFRYKCNSTLLFFFYMGVNSIRPEKFNYCPLVPRGLNKKEANISEQFLCLQQQFNIFNLWVSYDIRFSLRSFSKGKKE